MTTDSTEKRFQYEPYDLLNYEQIPYLLHDADTIADIFKGLEMCLDMVYQADHENAMLKRHDSEKMLRFCKGVCKIAKAYSIDKVDAICQRYLKD